MTTKGNAVSVLQAGARLCCALAGAVGLAGGLLADELKVEKGHPKTISSDVTYDTVDLHDNLTIDNKTTLTLADNQNGHCVFVATNAGDDVTLTLKDGGRLFQRAGQGGYLLIGGDGSPAGSGGFGRIRIEGRHDAKYTGNDTFRMRYIVVDSGAAVPTDGSDNTVLYIGSNTLGRAQVWTKGVQNWNLSPIRVQFDGGYLCSTDSGGEYWFASSSGAKGTIIVESRNGHPIQFENSGHSDKTLYNATGKIVFVGDGDIIATPGSNVAAGKTAFDYRTPITGTSDNYDWSAFHGNVFVGQGRLEVSGANVLPCHAGCGVIGSTAAKSFIDIKKDNAVNGFDCLGVVTNSDAGTTSTVTVGQFKDAPLKATSIAPSVLVKQVGTHVMTLEAPFVGRYWLDCGTLSVKKDVTFGELSLAEGTALMIDGCVARISPAGFSDAGATVTCVNGGRLDFVAEDDCGVYLSTLPSEDFAKVGAGTLTVNQRAAFESGRLTVKEGTLRLAGLGLTNEWWRITIARAVGGWYPFLSCTGLFAEDGHVPVTEGGAYTCISTEDASILQRGQTAFVEKPTEDVKGNIRYEMPSGQAVAANPNTTYMKDISALLSSVADSACCFSRFESPTAVNKWAGVTPQYPVVFSLRRATGDDVPVTGFSVRMPWNSNNAAHTNRYVSAWKVETSPDGVNWAVVQDHSTSAKEVSLGKYGRDPWGRWHGGNGETEEADKTSPDFEKCLAPLPLDIPAGSPTPGAKGMAAAVGVQVCAGATLDCSLVAGGQELGDLTVDLAAGCGTLKGVKLAETGTLRIRNVPQGFRKSGYVVPLTFVDSTTTGNLSGWTVEIDGEPIVNGLCWEAGKLMIRKLGMLILFK